MTAFAWEEGPLGKQHDRNGFDCGDENLNGYLRRYARQNHESGGAKCYVVSGLENPARIFGFYTLSPACIAFASAPAIASRGLGRYDVPVFRLGRIAVDTSMQGQGVGGRLLIRAAKRCIRVAQEVGGVALLIDAKDERAARWYESYDAARLLDAPLSLVLPFSVVAKARLSED